ncbi:MAG: NlpC/P60 family protein [Pseudomonadota bacterium]
MYEDIGTRVATAARAWLGTPYHHQASCRLAGCDCLGLVRGIWREVMGAEPEVPEPYSPDWGEFSPRDSLLDAARRHLVMGEGRAAGIDRVAGDERRAAAPAAPHTGDILIFRMRAGAVAKHVGIATRPGFFIHAQEHLGVVEVPLTPWWRRRVCGIFSFPQRGS